MLSAVFNRYEKVVWYCLLLCSFLYTTALRTVNTFRYQCKSVEYNSLSHNCSLYDHQVSVARALNSTIFYGESVIYRKECRSGNCIPRQSRAYLGFRLVTLPPPMRFSLPCDNSNTICLRSFNFGMWVNMVDVSSKFEFRPWPYTNRPMQAT